jgi:hypothetical protein
MTRIAFFLAGRSVLAKCLTLLSIPSSVLAFSLRLALYHVLFSHQLLL